MCSREGKNFITRKLYKLFAYIRFGFFAKKILKENDYAGVFVFTPNVGMLCFNVLKNKYNNRYILDIRDYWKENQKWLQVIEKHLVKYSYANVISSRAYVRFLPNADYVITHNSQNIDNELIEMFRNRKKKVDRKIVLSCIGAVKYIEYDKKVIDYFANDDRFELRYIGRGYEQLEPYCHKRGINNVKVEGIFPMEDTIDKYKGTDIILNMYGNNNPKLDYALSNKLYFAAHLGLPILVCENTYMEEISRKYKFGFSINLSNLEDKEKLYEYYSSIDNVEFNKNCDIFLDEVCEDEKEFVKMVRAFIEND